MNLTLDGLPSSLAGLDGPVAVLMGGGSAEREISLQSGRKVSEALRRLDVEVIEIDTADNPASRLQGAAVACCFIALHGRGGEDGTVQGLLESMGISYTGSGVLASALACHKLMSKLLWHQQRVRTPEFVRLERDSDWSAVSRKLGSRVVVKPAREGSSFGISLAEDGPSLQAAWQEARRYDPLVFAERWVDGREFSVAVLGDHALPAVGIEVPGNFYDYEAKYLSEETRFLIPCGLDEMNERYLGELALKAWNALGCEGWGRVDLMEDQEQGNFQVLELNTVPGMTDHSLVPLAASAAGIHFDALVARILLIGLEKKVGMQAFMEAGS